MRILVACEESQAVTVEFRKLGHEAYSCDIQPCSGVSASLGRPVQTDWGEVEHVCIRNVDNTDIPWADKQRIKNELFGEERTAVEVFPAESQLVDEANMYHLWILPKNMKLPFGL